jgi:uncharacterized protein (DUF2126 family)
MVSTSFKQRFAGGFIHFGQGKWYPWRIIPSLAICIILEKDGLPLWKNDAGEEGETNCFHDAEKFAAELANI